MKHRLKQTKAKATSNNDKVDDLGPFREDSANEDLTTNQGLRINDDQNSLKAHERGPSLLEDFLLREKITHFDHERIPEPRRGGSWVFPGIRIDGILYKSQISPKPVSQDAGLRSLLDRRGLARVV